MECRRDQYGLSIWKKTRKIYNVVVKLGFWRLEKQGSLENGQKNAGSAQVCHFHLPKHITKRHLYCVLYVYLHIYIYLYMHIWSHLYIWSIFITVYQIRAYMIQGKPKWLAPGKENYFPQDDGTCARHLQHVLGGLKIAGAMGQNVDSDSILTGRGGLQG